MLCDLTPSKSDHPIAALLGTGTPVVRLQQGLYQVPHWNPEYLFVEKLVSFRGNLPRHLTEEERQLPEADRDEIYRRNLREWMDRNDKAREAMQQLYREKYNRDWPEDAGLDAPDYGVVDTPTQLLELFPHLVDDEVRRAITFVEIRREDQSPNCGWRYHKWGHYWGNQNPQHEYLYDDKHIDAVWTFHIYGLK